MHFILLPFHIYFLPWPNASRHHLPLQGINFIIKTNKLIIPWPKPLTTPIKNTSWVWGKTKKETHEYRDISTNIVHLDLAWHNIHHPYIYHSRKPYSFQKFKSQLGHKNNLISHQHNINTKQEWCIHGRVSFPSHSKI